MSKVYLDDVEIVRQFVEGQGTLIANASLRIQAALDTTQLIASNGHILAFARLQNCPSTILIRSQSDYAELLHQVLEAYEYFSVGPDPKTQFQMYEHHQVPAGYQLHCAPARNMWRQWWLQHRQQAAASNLQTAFQLLVAGEWAPIQSVLLSQGNLYITTPFGETLHQGHDRIVWIEEQAEDSVDEPTQFLTAEMAEAQGHTTPQFPHGQAVQERYAVPSRPDDTIPIPLQGVVRSESGKLYVRTTLGEVVIEGSHLNCRLNRRPQQLVHRAPSRAKFRQ